MKLYVELELETKETEAAAVSAVHEALGDGWLQEAVRDNSEGGVEVLGTAVLTEQECFAEPGTPAVDDDAAARGLVAEHGSDVQKRQYAAGLLPEDDLRELIRRHVFGPAMVDVDGHPFARVDRVEDGFQHARACFRPRPLEIDSGAAEELPGEAFVALERISAIAQHRLADYAVSVQARFHRAYCSACAEQRLEYGALVSIEFAGRKLSREYSL